MSTFHARYEGRCPSCSEHIEIGDRIGYDDDDRVLCVECLGDVSRRSLGLPPDPVCPTCWLVHRDGACDR